MKGYTPAAIRAALRGDLDNFMVAATPGGIEAQEARGQRDFVQSETMPRRYNGDFEHGSTTDILTRLGFQVLGEADDLFLSVKLPQGWKKVATDHSMWSKIVDEQGRQRIAIFYKAAFYDRSAHFSLNNRFRATEEPVNGYGDNFRLDDDRIARVYDRDTLIWEGESVAKADWKALDGLRAQAKAWLAERYPDYESPFAYWD